MSQIDRWSVTMIGVLRPQLRLLKLTVALTWRNYECARLARAARKRDKFLTCLLSCVGREFMAAESGVTSVGYHIQPRPGYATNKNEVRTSEICWEAPVCITAYYHQQPLVGMAVELKGSVLSIRQLQGVPGAVMPVSLRKWPALFVQASKNVLYNREEVTTLRLYDADQRPSYQHPVNSLSTEEMQSYHQHLRRRYDGTARQQGFKKRHPKFWEWDLSLVQK